MLCQLVFCLALKWSTVLRVFTGLPPSGSDLSYCPHRTRPHIHADTVVYFHNCCSLKLASIRLISLWGCYMALEHTPKVHHSPLTYTDLNRITKTDESAACHTARQTGSPSSPTQKMATALLLNIPSYTLKTFELT